MEIDATLVAWSRRARKRMPNPDQQLARAEKWSDRLTGGRGSRNLMKALLALIEADEKPGPATDVPVKTVAHGAREVLRKRNDQPELPW